MPDSPRSLKLYRWLFSVVNALLLRSLPFEDPSRLASLRTYLVLHDSVRQFHDWRRQAIRGTAP